MEVSRQDDFQRRPQSETSLKFQKMKCLFIITHVLICICFLFCIEGTKWIDDPSPMTYFKRLSELESDNVTDVKNFFKKSFYGDWTSNQILPEFKQIKGKAQIFFSQFESYKRKCGEFYNYQVVLYDGKYNNASLSFTNSYPFLLEDDYPVIKVAKNTTEENTTTTISISNNLLLTRTTKKEMKIKKNQFIRANISLENEDKKLNGFIQYNETLITFNLEENSQNFFGEISALCIFIFVLGVAQIIVYTILSKEVLKNPQEGLKYSTNFIMINCMYNAMIGYQCFSTMRINSGLYILFLGPTLIYFALFSFFEPKFILDLIETQIKDTVNEDRSRIACAWKKIFCQFILFYLLAAVLIFWLKDMLFWKTTAFIFGILTFTPQVYYSLHFERKNEISNFLIIILTTNRIFIPMFFRGHYSFLSFKEDYFFCCTLVSLVYLQYFLMKIQVISGNPTCLRFMLNGKYNYYHSIKELEKSNFDFSGKLCTICLNGFVSEESNKNTSSINTDAELPVCEKDTKSLNKDLPLKIKEISKKEDKIVFIKRHLCCFKKNVHNDLIMITPCNHLFHPNCLRTWMKMKSTCPDCRSRIPLAI